MCGGEESLGTAEDSKGELALIPDAVEHAFDDVACFIEFGVIFELHLAVFTGRDAGCCFDLEQPVTQMIGVVSTVGNDGAAFANMTLKAVAGLTITHQMQLVYSPAVC